MMNLYRKTARILTYSAAMLLIGGCGVNRPGRAESAVMNWIKHRITVGGTSDRNPLRQDASVIRDGQTAFDSYCTVCHGLDGQSTGVPFADQISPPIPSLASRQVQQYSDGQLKWIIENGISPSGMPASRGILSDEEMWSIVEFLRHLPAAGSLGEPSVYTGDCSGHPEQSLAPAPPLPRSGGKRGSRLCVRS